MQTLFFRALVLQAGCGLLLVLGGSAAFAWTAPDSWAGLSALLAHFCGLMLLYSALKVWMEQFGGRNRLARPAGRGAGQGCGVALVRLTLLLALATGGGIWGYFALIDMNEVRLLIADGRIATAQVIGRDIVPAPALVGYVHYAYRTSPTEAPENRFAVPHRDYARYRIGARFDVTYAAGAHRVHRIGHVDGSYAIRRLLYWLLLLAGVGGYLFLPLWLLEFRRQRPSDRAGHLANPSPRSK